MLIICLLMTKIKKFCENYKNKIRHKKIILLNMSMNAKIVVKKKNRPLILLVVMVAKVAVLRFERMENSVVVTQSKKLMIQAKKPSA